jgi:hypothetical protein
MIRDGIVHNTDRPDADPAGNGSLRVDASQRFSLANLLLLVTCAAVVLAVGRMLPPPIFAGVCGTVAFFYLVLLSVLQVQSAMWHVGWWLLLVTYLAAAGWAVSLR